MELLLALDFGSVEASFSLHQGPISAPKMLIETMLPGRDHSENFLPALNAALKELGFQVRDISAAFTTMGPGSFTGQRIAFSSLKALAIGNGVSMYVTSGMEVRALCWELGQASPPKSFSIYESLGRGRVLTQRFERRGSSLIVATKPTLTSDSIKNQAQWILKSSDIVKMFSRCPTQDKYSTTQELSQAAPIYYGETLFKKQT